MVYRRAFRDIRHLWLPSGIASRSTHYGSSPV